MKKNDLQQTLAQAALELNIPAGNKIEFSSLEAIRKNKKSFIEATHQTLKKWHNHSIRQILVFDEVTHVEAQKPIGNPTVSEWADYSRVIWRRLNDAIIWIVCGMDRYMVKRLCFYRHRTCLSENNPESILSLLDSLNADPLMIALWNDATTCVDIGDITLSRPTEPDSLQFIEVKEGKINKAISDVLSEMENGKSKIHFDDFLRNYGKKGLNQLKRVQNQILRSRQANTLLNSNKGIDPVSGKEIFVAEINADNQDWNNSLNQVLQEAVKTKKEVILELDNCLTVYANADSSINFVDAKRRFIDILKKQEPRLTPAIKKNDLGRPVSLLEGLYHPASLPLFLRPIDPDLVGEVLYGRLYRRVLLYFNWVGFASKIEEVGGTLGWASDKEAAGLLCKPWDERPFMVFGKVPKIKFGHKILYPTGSNMDQLFFDGITPKTLAQRQAEGARKMEALIKQSG